MDKPMLWRRRLIRKLIDGKKLYIIDNLLSEDEQSNIEIRKENSVFQRKHKTLIDDKDDYSEYSKHDIFVRQQQFGLEDGAK